MRIIGGHDYYDSGMAWGQDTDILFVRGDATMTPADVEALGVPCLGFAGSFCRGDSTKRSSDSASRDVTVSTAHVIFCGKMYSGLRIKFGSYSPYFPNPLHGDFWFWDLASLEAWAAERELEIVGHDLSLPRWRWTHHHENVTYVSPADFFGPKELSKDLLARLIAQRITILSYSPGDYDMKLRKHIWRLDQGSLKPLQFFRAIDPTTAFQEISMWVGGVLGSTAPNTVEITDDKVKITKKGFDLRSSFRRMKNNAA